MGNTPAAWAYPDCPECETDVFVAGRQGRPREEYRCQFCGTIFGGSDD